MATRNARQETVNEGVTAVAASSTGATNKPKAPKSKTGRRPRRKAKTPQSATPREQSDKNAITGKTSETSSAVQKKKTSRDRSKTAKKSKANRAPRKVESRTAAPTVTAHGQSQNAQAPATQKKRKSRSRQSASGNSVSGKTVSGKSAIDEKKSADLDQQERKAPAEQDDFSAGLELESPNESATQKTSDESTPLKSEKFDHETAPTKLVLKKRPTRRARSRKRKTEPETAADGASGETEAESTMTRQRPADSKVAGAGEAKKDVAAEAPERPRQKGTKTRKRSTQKTAKTQTTTPEPVASTSRTESADAKNEKVEKDVIPFDAGAATATKKGRDMIINVTAGAECRIAVLTDGKLEELYFERRSAESHVGNIYKGVITNVEPSIQAAFVDFGLAKNGFLHVSDVQPRYFPSGSDETEEVGKKVPRKERPPIQKCFRRGDKVIVQVAKEGVGTKGPTLTTYLAIPGRFLVMMPGMNKLGVSRKIEDETVRRAMRSVLSELSLPEGIGFILRTAGEDRTKRELQSDLNYLSRLWKTVESRINRSKAPCELYQESDLVIRTIRDVYSNDFVRVVVDNSSTAQKVRDFLRIAAPRSTGKIYEYNGGTPIFHHFGIEQEIQRIHARKVHLRSGGSIVIDSTEAMVAIDVNSGKFRELQDAEETAYRINLEAAEEIARQLRLRDLGGLVVCDFIDMRLDRHKRAVEKALRDALRKHKERARILRMSKFGLIEMTRQRQRPSIKRSVYHDCPYCNGSGLIKTPESMSLEILRVLQLLAHRKGVQKITMSVAPPVAALVLNQRRAHLHELEGKTRTAIIIRTDATLTLDQYSFQCEDDRQMPLQIDL